MTDKSKETVGHEWTEDACKIFDDHAKDLGWNKHIYSDRLRDLLARVDELERVLLPFSEVAGTLFAKNFNANDLVVDEGPHINDCLTFQNFLDARRTLKADTLESAKASAEQEDKA